MAVDEEPELPEFTVPKQTAPDCPFCGEAMTFVDGEYACLDCNGNDLGPETG